MDTYANSYSYYQGYDYMPSGGAVAVILAIIGVILFISFILAVMSTVGLWKMFKKAGEPGWKSIIPVYNIYTLCQITGVNPWWIVISFVGCFVVVFIPFIGFIGSIASLYFSIILAISIAKSFGKDEGFGIGLIFLSPIFYLILGCGKSQYVGKKPVKDAILESFVKTNSTTTPEASVQDVSEVKKETKKDSKEKAKFCSQCGNKITDYDRFCPKCGHEL